MQLSHTRPVGAAKFDDPNLVSCAGLVPTVALAQQCDLAALADEHLSVPTNPRVPDPWGRTRVLKEKH